MMHRRLRLQLLLALFVSFSWLSISCDEAPAIPEVVIDGAPAVVYVGEAFELHASAEPLEGVSYAWRWSVPEGAADVDPADSARVSVTPAAAGVLSLRVRVSDEIDSSRYSEATASFRVVPKLSKEITEIVLADVLPASSIPASGSSSAVEWKVSDEGLNGESSAWLAANVSISGGVLLLRDGSNPPEDGVFEVQAYRDGAPIEGVRISVALRHTHVFGENFQRDGSHHWHAALCGHDLTTLKEPHDWSDDFVCYTCGYRHNHSWSGWIPDSNDLSLHVRTSLCGHFPEESAPHVLTAENGYVCPDCGYSHAHSFEEAWSHDGSSHWHASSCGHPVRSEEQAHSYGEDWVCSACGFHHEHEADLSKWISNASSHWRIAPCHSGVRLLEQAHSYDADWNCIECGFHHDHEWGGLESDAEGHWRRTSCHPDVMTAKEPHAFALSGDSYVCSACGWGHEHEFDDGTWLHGETTHWHPALCGHDVRGGESDHVWGDWTITAQPTCVAAGEKSRSCQTCGRVETDSVSATGIHSWGDWSVSSAASCESSGEDERFCSACAARETRVVNALGHDWSLLWSCDGSNHWHVCSRCDAHSSESPHSFGDWQTVAAATCTQAGSERRFCTVCNHEEMRETDALGHDWSDQQVLVQASCADAGSWQRTCSRCQSVDGPHAIAALGHDWSEAWTSDGSNHWHACSRCDAHSSESPHSFGDWQVVAAATCTQAGSERHSCSVCNHEDSREIAALGHLLVWHGDENDHWQECQREGCSYATAKQPHSYDSNGLCSDCGRRELLTMLPGLFTINSNGDKVRFTRGSLRATKTVSGFDWSFAVHQYDIVGNAPGNTRIGSLQIGDVVDMFGWPTANNNYGISASTNANDYAGDFQDFGVVFGIDSIWTTLTKDEWSYVYNRDGKRGAATVAGVCGLVLLPDSWDDSELPVFVAGTTSSQLQDYTVNVYSAEQWAAMETAGAVFLPAAGFRVNGTDISQFGYTGNYWGLVPYVQGATTAPYFNTVYGIQSNTSVTNGFTIRLVERVHEHAFSSEWSFDDERHWHEATCGHDIRTDEEAHAFGDNGLCSVCGRLDPSGPLPGVFTVSASGNQVRFSRGNLYWNGSAFAVESDQYDYRTWPVSGTANAVIGGQAAETPSGSTGLFYWSKNVETTYALNYNSNDGLATNGEAYALANGGAISGFDILTYDEWAYLLDRGAASSRRGLATVTGLAGANSVKGLVLIPDSWSLPSGLGFTSGYAGGFSTNSYTADQWKSMENAGAVFLPVAAQRSGAEVYDFNSYGYYWSALPKGSSGDAYNIYICSNAIGAAGYYRGRARSVRLVERQ